MSSCISTYVCISKCLLEVRLERFVTEGNILSGHVSREFCSLSEDQGRAFEDTVEAGHVRAVGVGKGSHV